MITYDCVLRQYEVVARADRFIQDHIPIVQQVLAHQGKNERLTVCSIGEEIMGKDAYHEKYVYKWGEEANFRTYEARELTGVLTQIFRKLCLMGVMERHEYRDTEHPIEIETEDWIYYDREGNQLPEEIELTLVDGRTIKIAAESISGVRRKLGPCKQKIYPKMSYYTFK